MLVAVLLAGCSSKEERVEAGLRKSVEHVRTSDWDKARVEVRNVLKIDPRNARAHLIDARIAEGLGDIQRAHASYLKAIELDAALADAKVGLARLYVFAGESSRAQALVDQILATDAQHPGALTVQAAIVARRGDLAGATEKAHAVLSGQETAPAETSMLLAALYVRQDDAFRAAQVVANALKIEPSNTALLQVAAMIAGEPKAPPDVARRAPEYYRRATQLAPRDTQMWGAWAAYHIRRGEADNAEAVLRSAQQAVPDDGRRVLNLAEFLAARHGYETARRELQAAIDRRPRDTELRFGLVKLHRSDNRDADARKALGEILELTSDAPAQARARVELAAYHVTAAQFAQAQTLIAEVLKTNPRDPAALELRGRLLLREGKPGEAVGDLRVALRDQPGSLELIALLARAHLLAGQGELARDALVDAIKYKPEEVELHLLLAGVLADLKDAKGALSEINSAIFMRPDLPRLYEFKAQLLVQSKDPAGAEKALAELKNRLPQQPIGYLRLGRFLAEQSRWDDALRVYDEGMRKLPADQSLALAAVGLLSRQQRYAEAERRIDALASIQPGNPLHLQVRGDLAMSRQDPVAAEAAYRRIVETAPKVTLGYLGVARALVARGNLPAALNVLQQAEAANPQDLVLPAARAQWLVGAGRVDEAIQVYEAMMAKSPIDEAANNLAFLLADVKGDAANLHRALRLIGHFADSRNPVYLDTLGWVHHRLGQHAEAIGLLTRAVALQPDSPVFAAHLGIALVKGGQTNRGQAILRSVVAARADVPHAEEVRRLAGVN